MKSDVVMKHFELKTLLQFQSMIEVAKGSNCCSTYKSKSLNVDMYSKVHEPISFNVGVIMHTADLYIWIPVYVILILIQGHRGERKHINYMTVFN